MAIDYKERAREREKQRKQSVWLKLAEGENTFRMLPTPQGSESGPVFYEYAVHREVGPKKVTVRCGKDLEGEGDCWLCDKKIPALREKGQDARAEALAPRDILMIQVAKYDVDAEKFAGPYLFTPSKTLGDSLLRLLGSKKRDYVSASKGYNLTVSRTGTGKNDTRYSAVEVDEEPMPITKELMAKLKPFDQLKEIPVYSEGAQKAAYQGIDYIADEDDEDTAPRTRSRKPAAPEPEDDDSTDEPDADDDAVEEEGEEDAEEEEEVPPPSKKHGKLPPAKPSKKPAKAEVEDDDELGEDDLDEDAIEEEDEDEAPPPSKKSGKPAPKKPAKDEDDDLSDIDLDDLEDDEPDTPPVKKPAAKKPSAAPLLKKKTKR